MGEDDDIRIIEVCGTSGIGKTTLAKVVHNQMSPHFEGKSFLVDVREISEKCGLVSLQKQLLSQILFDESFNFFNIHEGKAIISHRLSHKRVLVVLDDVENLLHLKCLVGMRNWFSVGSRIIVTKKDEHLLRSYRVDGVYKPTTLKANNAHHLFNLKAFGCETVPKEDFIELAKHVVGYAGGLPLALKVLGSLLCDRDARQWTSAIEGLERDSNKEILDRLQISFDGLEEREKNIFLNIACFFNGEEKDFVMKVLDGCEFFPPLYKLKVLNLKGSKNLIKAPDFTTTPNLKILVLEGCTRLVYVHPSIGVLTRLKLLNLRGCKSLRSFPTKIGMESLEMLILLGCSKLQSFLEIDGKIEYLLELWFDGINIKELPSSIENLSSLVLLNLKDCRDLVDLPGSIDGFEFINKLNLRDCNLCEGDIPRDISRLSSLKQLDLRSNNFISIPSSLTRIPKLDFLRLSDCRALKSLPELQTSITNVRINGCTSLEIVENPTNSSKVCNLKDWATILGVNCFRLAENIDALTLLKKYLNIR
ncbi:hypothetical protein GOBAR_AA23406 [Gossypium barbadense]|uniref:AAA+ ATPase domain-containing protein n=1 Tax=Gossypium barbadense TaxID=3634 RepID=A0A2P5X1N5_GOSBA|nr:hypothetical protein GOBAR_AA23406 [Gossypium barbadense]